MKSRSFHFLLFATLLLAYPADASSTRGIPTDKVHVFYYPWYRNPDVDGRWEHWNHPIFPQTGPITFYYTPPEDIGASFYPELGPYSSFDKSVLETHADQILSTGAKVVNLSWWGPGNYIDQAAARFVEVAEEKGLLVNFTIEPYGGRSAASVKNNIVYLLDRYRDSPALYRLESHGNRPMFYVYDSYLIQAAQWAQVLAPTGPQTIRGTDYDSVMIALYVNENDRSLILNGGFDGFYTYFATKGFTEGSMPSRWPRIKLFADMFGKIAIFNVGPGYDDTRVRPWNEVNLRLREGGAYYDSFFQEAINAAPDIIGITTFNEWHEGTQIEPAVPKTIPVHTYRDYTPEAPDFYLKKTRDWVKKFLSVVETGRENYWLFR